MNQTVQLSDIPGICLPSILLHMITDVRYHMGFHRGPYGMDPIS